jgi:hypothetical protein
MDQTAIDINAHTAQQGSPVIGLIVSLVLYVGLMSLIFWKVFTKAGHPGWAAFVPIYNLYILCKIGGKPGWWLLLCLIPIVNYVMLLLIALGVAKNFGKGGGFGVGLWLLAPIFYPVLGFGSAKYSPVAA